MYECSSSTWASKSPKFNEESTFICFSGYMVFLCDKEKVYCQREDSVAYKNKAKTFVSTLGIVIVYTIMMYTVIQCTQFWPPPVSLFLHLYFLHRRHKRSSSDRAFCKDCPLTMQGKRSDPKSRKNLNLPYFLSLLPFLRKEIITFRLLILVGCFMHIM